MKENIFKPDNYTDLFLFCTEKWNKPAYANGS